MGDAALAFDNEYNRRIRSILNDLQHMDVLTQQPELFEDGRVRKYILPGTSGQYPPVHLLGELQAMGGKISRFKKATKWTKYAVDTADKGLDLAAKAVAIGGKISRSKKAKKWTGYAIDTADKGLDLASKAMSIGGKISRSKKAKKWTGYAVDTASKGLDLASKAMSLGGRKPRGVPQPVNKVMSGGGRSARAEIVKRVMAEKGLGMIAASKYVKEKGLY
jgi:hypothetical protein